MIKKITPTVIVLLIFFSRPVFSQVTLQASNLPVPGDLWSNKTISDTTIQPGPGGSNMNWNFSNYFVNPSVISEQYVTPTGAGNDALFPASNLKVNSFFGGDDYYVKTSNSLQYLGTKSNTNEIIINNTQTLLSVPFSFDDSIVNPAVSGMGFGYPLTGTISVKADGSGSLSLFTGAFTNTLRVFTDMNLVLGAGTGVDTYIQLQRYTWYSSSYRAPVFQISILDVNGPLGNTHQKVTTVSTLTTDVNDLSSHVFQFSISPNPAGTGAALAIDMKRNAEIELRIADLTGKILTAEKHSLAYGQNSLHLDLADYPKGIYVVSVVSGNASSRQRLVID
jgi:hypothetical protein